MIRRRAAPPPPRIRRDPEAARALILDTAAALFADRGPDAVGIKDVARRAGISHALVTHYFGTFDALVESVLERHAAQLRQEIQALVAGDDPLDPGALLDRVWEAAKDPTTARLMAWALLSGRSDGAQFFPRRVKGLKLVVDALEARSRSRRLPALSRAELEDLVATAVAFTFGYALMRGALAASLGRDESDADDARLRRGFQAFIDAQLARAKSPKS
jgi:TetR/AcrR family transcriptional regulator, repressor for neighboring sulfatase